MTIGIDFGTSYSAVSWLNPVTGKSEIIRDENGLEKVPSLVYLKDGGTLVGTGAENLFEDASQMVPDECESILSRMMRGIKRELVPGRTIPLPDGSMVSPETVVSEILGYLRRTANEQCIRDEIDSVVLTHPVAFTSGQCGLLKKAAIDAGFTTVVLHPEPVAAAAGYLSSGAAIGKRIVVFDLGGGTLDLAYLERGSNGQEWTVLCQKGLIDCGGNDFDQILYDYFENRCIAERGHGFSGESGSLNLQVLREAQKLKEALTNRETATFSYFDEHSCSSFKCSMGRVDFEKIATKLLLKISTTVDSFLSSLADVGGQPDTVIMIGGASRMPCVSRALRERVVQYGVEPLATIHVDVAVALGASAFSLITEKHKPENQNDVEDYEKPSSTTKHTPGIEKVLETRLGDLYSPYLKDVFKEFC